VRQSDDRLPALQFLEMVRQAMPLDDGYGGRLRDERMAAASAGGCNEKYSRGCNEKSGPPIHR
jgi:hypothetical protein